MEQNTLEWLQELGCTDNLSIEGCGARLRILGEYSAMALYEENSSEILEIIESSCDAIRNYLYNLRESVSQ